MGFLRNVAGLAICVPLTALLSHYTGLEQYALAIFGIQWAGALLYAVPFQDEKYLDVTGSLTFASVSALAFYQADHPGWRGALLTAMTWLWCARLGAFLFIRIRECGEDTRFEVIRVTPLRFFSLWNIQGLWVFLTLLPVLLTIVHGVDNPAVEPLDVAGAAVWTIGYFLEVVADWQKTLFRRDSRNKGKFISSGLWTYSRHPNYLGEMMMWVGAFLLAVHALPVALFQALAALGPLFIIILLTTVSGIPLLEKQGDERWGATKAYQDYKARTPVLFLAPPKTLKAEAPRAA
jgi:steroid 5-alpha reductase family enzyme